MHYEQIKETAYGYADRTDDEALGMYDNFLKVVESRVNRYLSVRQQYKRATIYLTQNSSYYGLPSDFKEMRDIEYYDIATPSAKTTMHYASPEQMNTAIQTNSSRDIYTIIADQIQVQPITDGDKLEIVYAQRMSELNETDIENWLSLVAPDVYVFGVVTEISAFVKDANAAQLWDQRFKDAVVELKEDDSKNRWSGTPMTMRVE